jgi:hypothetical protein
MRIKLTIEIEYDATAGNYPNDCVTAEHIGKFDFEQTDSWDAWSDTSTWRLAKVEQVQA